MIVIDAATTSSEWRESIVNDEGNETKKKTTMAEDEDDDCSFHGTDFDAIRMHHMREEVQDSDSDQHTEVDPHVMLFN